MGRIILLIRISYTLYFLSLGMSSPNPFDLKEMGAGLPVGAAGGVGGQEISLGTNGAATGAKPKKSVQSLLGEHSKLVNLDNLVSDSQPGKYLTEFFGSKYKSIIKNTF